MARAVSHSHPELTVGRGTKLLAGAAVTATAATIFFEWARVWRHDVRAAPDQRHDLLADGRVAGRDTLAVIREGYRVSPNRENAIFNMLAAFAVTFGGARAITALIRSGRVEGLLGNVSIGDRHIHHFVPGFILGFAAGGIGIAWRRDGVERWLAVPFGAGAALVFDEAALLLEMEDVYWSERGVLSLQISFATIALLASLALGIRLMRRGEELVLAPADS